MSADAFDIALGQAARSLVSEPIPTDVIEAGANLGLRLGQRSHGRVPQRLVVVLALVGAIVVAGLALTPGSPFRLLVATVASPSPTVSSAVPVATSTENPSATPTLETASPSIASPSAVATATSSESPGPATSESPTASGLGTRLVAFSTEDRSRGPWLLSIANEDGSDARVIGNGWFLSWSPSGRYLLAASDHGEVALDATGQTIGTFPRGTAVWSPSDQVLVTSGGSNGGPRDTIGLYDIDGSLVRNIQLPNQWTGFSDASWAPDGHAFVAGGCTGCGAGSQPRDRVLDLWVFAADGSGSTKITDTPRVVEYLATWSPDGTAISFTTSCRTAHEQCGDAMYGTWLINPDGSDPRLILSHTLGAAWSADGSRLLYVKGDTPVDADHVFVSGADGNDPIQLSDGPGYDRSPQWQSPDRVAYVHVDPKTDWGQGRVLVTRADGTQSQPDDIGIGWLSFGWQP